MGKKRDEQNVQTLLRNTCHIIATPIENVARRNISRLLQYLDIICVTLACFTFNILCFSFYSFIKSNHL